MLTRTVGSDQTTNSTATAMEWCRPRRVRAGRLDLDGFRRPAARSDYTEQSIGFALGLSLDTDVIAKVFNKDGSASERRGSIITVLRARSAAGSVCM